MGPNGPAHKTPQGNNVHTPARRPCRGFHRRILISPVCRHIGDRQSCAGMQPCIPAFFLKQGAGGGRPAGRERRRRGPGPAGFGLDQVTGRGRQRRGMDFRAVEFPAARANPHDVPRIMGGMRKIVESRGHQAGKMAPPIEKADIEIHRTAFRAGQHHPTGSRRHQLCWQAENNF